MSPQGRTSYRKDTAGAKIPKYNKPEIKTNSVGLGKELRGEVGTVNGEDTSLILKGLASFVSLKYWRRPLKENSWKRVELQK